MSKTYLSIALTDMAGRQRSPVDTYKKEVHIMSNVVDLNEKVENDEIMEETKQVIEDSDKEVPVEEMGQVTGGDGFLKNLRPTFMTGRGVKEVE